MDLVNVVEFQMCGVCESDVADYRESCSMVCLMAESL